MFRMVQGDYSYSDLDNANRVFGPLCFLVYMFFVGILFMVKKRLYR